MICVRKLCGRLSVSFEKSVDDPVGVSDEFSSLTESDSTYVVGQYGVGARIFVMGSQR